VTVTDDTQLRLKAIRMTQKRELQYSPVRSSDRPTAAKAMTPMAVAPNSGHWFCATTSRTTSSLSSPASMPTLVPSMTMMALSVSMHRAMMSAPSEMRSIRRSPFMYMTRNVAMIVRNSTTPMINPVLRPIVRRSTTKTMVTALPRLKTNSFVAAVTAGTLDRVGDFLGDLPGAGPGVRGNDQRFLDRELRVLEPADLPVGHHPAQEGEQHGHEHHAVVADGQDAGAHG
jgi:hypothetical protein